MNNNKSLRLYFIIAFAWSWLINTPRVLAAFEIVSLNPGITTAIVSSSSIIRAEGSRKY